MNWVAVPRYRAQPMTLMHMSPCGHAETVEGYIYLGYPWWGCEICRTVRHIRAAAGLPLTYDPGTGRYHARL